VEIQAKRILRLKRQLNTIIAKHTGQHLMWLNVRVIVITL